MRKGFTLIELSIVLVIIGLLVGGVLVGQSLIDSVKVNKAISEGRQYEILIAQFDQRFKQLPGDFSRAQSVLGATYQGDGDGLIDWGSNSSGCASRDCELYSVMDHIKRAGFLSGDYDSTITYGAETRGWRDAGVNTLESGIDDDTSWFTIYSSFAGRGNVNYMSLGKCYRSATNSMPGNPSGGRGYADAHCYGGPFTPSMALSLDSKIDDGNPVNGSVYVGNGSNWVYAQCTSNAAGDTFAYGSSSKYWVEQDYATCSPFIELGHFNGVVK